jgi:molybdenum cofactor cytidylyltransferase
MKYIKEMINTFNKDKQYIVIPRHIYTNGNPVIFPIDKREELLNLKNDEKGKKIISEADKIKYVSVSKEMLIDIDTKEDYKKLGVQNEKNKNCR